MTIRQRLAAALVLALFPIFLLAAAQAAIAYRNDSAERRETLVRAAELATERARGRIETAQVLLQALSPRAVGFGCAPLLRNTAERLGDYELLVKFDRIARPTCASGNIPADPSRRYQDWFRRLAAGQSTVVLETAPGDFDARQRIIVATRAERDGAFDGALVAVVRLLALQPERRGLPAATAAALVDETGRWIGARPVDVAPPAGDWRRVALARGSYSWRAETPDGTRQHVVAPVLGDQVFAVLSIPDPGLLSLAWIDPVAILLLPLLAWGLSVLAVYVVAERIMLRWLVYLERIAGIYAKGRFSVRPVQAENAPLEIRQLSRTLDQMAETIVWRDQSLRESIEEKDVLMREIHHRVKNNLQIITSLLNMQQRALADPAARAALSDTRQRITALAIIYRALYQSPDLKQVDVRLFLSELLGQLMQGETSRRDRSIHAELEADSLIIDPDKLAPFALFAVEAITNAQTHAFPDRDGRLDVSFKVEGDEARLEIADDGVGWPENDVGDGVGRTLMTAFARQLRGRAEIVGRTGGGAVARLIFPVPGVRPKVRPAAVTPPAAKGNQAAA